MASPTPAGLKTAVYHCPIDASSDPTPVKPPLQKTQYITQVPRSPSISQRLRPSAASQNHSGDFVQDSLENRPSAPAHQPSTFLDFLNQSAPVENSQPADTSSGKVPIASRSQSQNQVIAQDSVEELSSKHRPSENHTIDEDSVKVPPPARLQSQGNTLDIADNTQRQTSSQKELITEHLSQAHTPAHTEPDDDDDDDDEDIQDCITVRSRPAIPPAKSDARKTAISSAGVSSASRGSEDIYNVTPLHRAGFLQPNVSATTAITTPSMPPKTSSTKGTTSASQSRKVASTTSKKSSKPAQPLPDIVNEGETSSTAILQKLRAGGISQANTTREASKALPKVVSGTGSSQKSAARPTQAPAKKSATKPAQQPQSRPAVPSTKETSRGAEHPEGRDEFAFSPDPIATKRPAVPWQPEEVKGKSTKTAKPTAASLSLSKKISKSQPKKKATKASESDEDNDDEEYSAPKTHKSRTSITTRASTRAQTQTATKNDGLNVSTRNSKASIVERKEQPVSRKTASSHRHEEIEDFEDSVTHINSGGAASPLPTTLSPRAKPPAIKQTKTRRMTKKEEQLMDYAISSPDRATTPAATKAQSSRKAPVPRASSSAAHETIAEQGTTKRNPVNIEDDDSSEDDENAMHEDYDASFGEVTTEVIGSKPQDKQKTSPTRDHGQSRVVVAATEPPVQQPSDRTTDIHPGLDLVAQERAQRKPNIVKFDANGPRNQGSRRQTKSSALDIHDPPFEEASSPDLDQFSVQEPLPTFFTTSGPDTRSKGVLDFKVAQVSTHQNTIAPLLSTTSRDVATSKLMSDAEQLRQTVMAVEISAAREMKSTKSESLAKAVTFDHKSTSTPRIEHYTSNTSLHDRHSSVEPQAQSEILVEEHSHQLSHKRGGSDRKLHKDTDMTKSLAPPAKEKASSTSDILRNPVPVDSTQRKHTQALSDQSDSHARPQIMQPQHIDRSAKTSGSKASKPLVEHNQEEITGTWSQLGHATPLAIGRKRPSMEVAGEAPKRLKLGHLGSRTQLTQPAAVKNPVSRKLSQVDDNGSPMPYGGEISQGTALLPQRRQSTIIAASTPTNLAMHEATNKPFARPTALARNEMSKPESPSKEMRALQEDSPPQVSQPITHAGFDRDDQFATEYLQTFNLHKDVPKHASPVPSRSPPRRAAPTQKSAGLMEALRSEAIQRADASGDRENDDKENPEPEEPMDEEDPDKTLVNEDSNDGDDSDDDGSGSRNSSDTDGEEVANSALSMWRDALDSHQGDVYDQLVRIAHCLTNHLKDHETAIKDINTDYSQDGTKLIQRLVKDNEAKLEQCCIKRSKIQGAVVMGCEKACNSLYNDMKDVRASGERLVKTLQRQVDAVGRLDQIMQDYQA
ncbi:hypothetical protein KCU65_g3543, partial [Aureobasidium melanogenum]